MPGAMRAKSVAVAGQDMRCQDTAKAAGTPSASPSSVDPVATIRLLSVLDEEVVAPEQLDEVLERRCEEEPGRDRGDLSARLEGGEEGPGDRDREHDEHDRELHRIRRFEELPSHHATALRSRAKTSTEPSTMLDSVTMMALA